MYDLEYPRSPLLMNFTQKVCEMKWDISELWRWMLPELGSTGHLVIDVTWIGVYLPDSPLMGDGLYWQ